YPTANAVFPVSLVVLSAIPLYLSRRLTRLEAILLIMRDRLASGMELSEVMASLPRVFPPYYLGLVRAGERSGKLADCLESLGSTVVQRLGVRQQLWANFGCL